MDSQSVSIVITALIIATASCVASVAYPLYERGSSNVLGYIRILAFVFSVSIALFVSFEHAVNFLESAF